MKKENKKKFKMDFGTFLLITGALANVPLWIGAFISTDAQGVVIVWIREMALPVLDSLAAVAMGITVAFGLVYVVVRLSKMKPTLETKVRGKDEYKSSPNIRFYGAVIALVLLLTISASLLSPIELLKLSSAQTLFDVLGTEWAGWWSLGRVVAADLALGAIALVHGVQFGATDATAAPKPASQSKQATTRTPKSKSGTASAVRVCEIKDCGLSYKWPNGKGAHYKKHHPDLVVFKTIPASVKYKNVDGNQ